MNNKVIVAGSREINCQKTVFWCLDYFLGGIMLDCQIVSGGARGIDKLGERWSVSRLGKKAKIFNADWDQYGKSAGPIRNQAMVEYATHLIAFWDGVSKGTINTIKNALKANLKVKIIYFKKRPSFGYNKKMDMFHHHVKVLKRKDFLKMIGD